MEIVKKVARERDWRHIWASNFRDWQALMRFLGLENLPEITSSSFSLNLPRRLAEKIEKKNLQDPLLLQFLPAKDSGASQGALDPVEDGAFCRTPKLLHKYHGRALLLCSSVCPMHCRYCFRQHFSYDKSRDFSQELEYISQNPSIQEVILSGGDPLSLSDEDLGALWEKLESIPHLKWLRLHTRFLIGIPERVTKEFLYRLTNTRFRCFVVTHTNHPREWDRDIVEACGKILQTKATMLSQTVLLKGVNDNVETLEGLMSQLVDAGVVPYYLHQLDLVAGGEYFAVPKSKGRRLIQALRARLPGYAVPRYVEELPHKNSKTNIPC